MTLLKVPYNENKTNDYGYYLNNQNEGKKSMSLIYRLNSNLFLDSAFFPGHHAQVIVKGENLGVIGVLHPNVIGQFGLKLPCSILEINIEPFV